jgi:hypothetical protein
MDRCTALIALLMSLAAVVCVIARGNAEEDTEIGRGPSPAGLGGPLGTGAGLGPPFVKLLYICLPKRTHGHVGVGGRIPLGVSLAGISPLLARMCPFQFIL